MNFETVMLIAGWLIMVGIIFEIMIYAINKKYDEIKRKRKRR